MRNFGWKIFNFSEKIGSYQSHTRNMAEEPKLAAELWKVGMLKQGMRNSQILTDNMMSILNSFEDTLDKLEKTMLPIHRSTNSLTIKQKNLAGTVNAVDDLISNHKLAQRSKSLVSQGEHFVCQLQSATQLGLKTNAFSFSVVEFRVWIPFVFCQKAT